MVDLIRFKCESWPVRCSAGFMGRAIALFGLSDEASTPFTLESTWRKCIRLHNMGWRGAAKRGCARRKLKTKTESEGAFQIERKKQGWLSKGVTLQYEIYLSRREWQRDQTACPPVQHCDGCKRAECCELWSWCTFPMVQQSAPTCSAVRVIKLSY